MSNKLVRDRIADAHWSDPGQKKYLRPARDTAELLTLLRKKLIEEVGELIEAANVGEVVEEAADLIEVAHAYAAHCGAGAGQVELARESKRRARGGFDAGVVWETGRVETERAMP